jgi:galactose mutarotase-like enzyme
MWRRPGPLRLWRNCPGDSFEKGTFAGADECLPTISACPWQGRVLPDHGEAWTLAWALDESVLAQGKIRTSVTLPLSPLRLTRTLELRDELLRMDYRLENLGTKPEFWLWAWHPLFSLENGDRLDLPPEVKHLGIESARPWPVSRRDRWEWPEPRPGIRLDELSLGSGDAFLKAFAGPVQKSRVRIFNPKTGTSLELVWDTDSLPFLGLWLTRGGYQGWHHVALEPTNLPADSVAEAVRENQPVPLGSGQRVSWWLEIRIRESGSESGVARS